MLVGRNSRPLSVMGVFVVQLMYKDTLPFTLFRTVKDGCSLCSRNRTKGPKAVAGASCTKPRKHSATSFSNKEGGAERGRMGKLSSGMEEEEEGEHAPVTFLIPLLILHCGPIQVVLSHYHKLTEPRRSLGCRVLKLKL